jgi:hypothetical protein
LVGLGGRAGFHGIGVILELVVITDAAYQIVYEKPSYLRIERALFKRVPATPEDCVLQGAGKLLSYIAILLVLMPMLLVIVINALGGLPPSERWASKGMYLGVMACAVVSLYLAISGAAVWRKVRFTYLSRTAKQS